MVDEWMDMAVSKKGCKWTIRFSLFFPLSFIYTVPDCRRLINVFTIPNRHYFGLL
jgi:hypothetical protein